MARALNHDRVRPLMVILKSKSDMVKKEKAILEYHELDDDMMKYADTPVDYDKSFKKHELQGPLIWEFHRTEDDKYFVETSKRFGLLNCHTNMQLLTSSDQAAPAEDYMCEYLNKMSELRLDGSTSTMLAAMNHTQEVKSKAADAGTELRNSIFLHKEP